jgi:ribosomal protein L25 (general stress protein Ctc)
VVEAAISAPGHWRRLRQRGGWPTVVWGYGGTVAVPERRRSAMVEMVAMAIYFCYRVKKRIL